MVDFILFLSGLFCIFVFLLGIFLVTVVMFYFVKEFIKRRKEKTSLLTEDEK